MIELFLFSFFFLAYVWIIYPLAIGLLASLVHKKSVDIASSPTMDVSVIIAAHNEAHHLKARIENIYVANYPAASIEVVVASDGSTDKTLTVLEDLAPHYPRLKWIDIMPQGGRANAHNRAFENAEGQILIFTDAETVFGPNLIRQITAAFADPGVGFASGTLGFRNIKKGEVTASLGFYWQFESWLREQETHVNINALGIGPCCAVRRDLFLLLPLTGDVDFTTPLDVVKAGARCVHIRDAVVSEVLPDSEGTEFRVRVRMTAKNLSGTLGRWGISGFIYHPLYSLALFSHKIGRWFTPVSLIGILMSTVLLVGQAPWALPVLFIQIFFLMLSLAGYLRIPLPLASHAYSFLIANAGFLIGIGKAVIGRVPKAYKPMSHV